MDASPAATRSGQPRQRNAFASLHAMSLRVLVVLLPLHLLAGWLFLRGCGPGFPLDDAWGHLVYGRAVALGEGFAYNPGQPEAGVSAPLWTLMLALPAGLVEWVGWPPRPDALVRAIGALLALLTAGLGWRLALRVSVWPAFWTALLLSIDPLLMIGRFSGMELPLFGLLTLLLIEALLDQRPGRAGLVAGLAVLTRPEGLALAAITVVVATGRRWPVRQVMLPLLLCALPFAAWNQWVAGQPWPVTWSNKFEAVAPTSPTLGVLGALMHDTGWGWALLPLAAIGGVAISGLVPRLAGLLLATSLVPLAGVLLTRAMPLGFDPPRVPFYWERYALVAWPPLLVLVAVGAASFARTAWAGLRCRPVAAVALIAPAALAALLARALPGHTVEASRRFAAECADVEALNVAAGRWIDGHLPPGDLVATHDAGAVRYFGRRPVLDLWGNNEHELNALLAEQAAARDPGEAVRAQLEVDRYLKRKHPAALAVFPALYAKGHSPEYEALVRQLPPGERQSLEAVATDFAAFFGLTRRAATFEVPHPAVVDSPLHQTMAVFVAP